MKNISFSVFLFLLCTALGTSYIQAQILNEGDLVATCFSGSDPSSPGYVAGIYPVQNANSQLPGQHWWPGGIYHGPANSWTKANLGEVFGIAVDDNYGHIYLTATSLYCPQTIWGPAGPGGVYKLDGTTGAISTLASLPNYPTPVVYTYVSGGAGNPSVLDDSLFNVLPGLGNVCYDAYHNQVYVTNFENGKIYAIATEGHTSATEGTVVDSLDPGTPDNGLPGFAPLGERLWGIASHGTSVNDVVVQYATWSEDRRLINQPSPAQNTIRSVQINANGTFDTSSDQLEFQIPDVARDLAYPLDSLYSISNPISDIAISTDGLRMVISQRSMNGDVKKDCNRDPAFAHLARTLEYQRPTTIIPWTAQSINKFQLGQNSPMNSSGGVSWGYANYDPNDSTISGCDSVLWMSGHALRIGTGNYIYGLQRTLESGGTSFSSVLIDIDNGLNVNDKTYVGDVEIFNPTCKQNDPCARLKLDADFGYVFDDSLFSIIVYDQSTVGSIGQIAWIEWCVDTNLYVGFPGDSLHLQFPRAGTYTVCLKVYGFAPDGNGNFVCCKDTICEEVTVGYCDNHHANMQVGPISGNQATLTDISNFGDRSLWMADISDPNSSYITLGVGTSITHTYPGPGVYTACLISWWHYNGVQCCIDTVYETIRIGTQTFPPCDSFDVSFTIAQDTGLTYLFTNTTTHAIGMPPASTSCKYNINGTPIPTNKGVTSYTFPGQGTYVICLICVANYPVLNGLVVQCRDTFCDTLTIRSPLFPSGPKIAAEVSPNPTWGQILVKFENDDRQLVILELYNLKGQRVREKRTFEPSSTVLHLQHLKEGMYTLRIRKGDRHNSIRILKK